MKLTNQQIEYVENYILSKDIKWYELQVELTDHMITSMEEFWAVDPDLTFDQVKDNTFKQFTKAELKAIEKERTKNISKEFFKTQRQMVMAYLKFPKIFVSIILTLIVFKLSFLFDNPQKYIAMLLSSSIVFYFPIIYNSAKNRKIDGKRFLTVELGTPVLSILFFPTVTLNVATQLKHEIIAYPYLVFAFCVLWMIGNLFLLTGLHLQKKTFQNVKQQYQMI
jgi:hypothetical protein